MMSERRFEFKLKVNFIDEETGEEIYHKVLIDNSNGNEIGFDDMVGLLNEQQATITKLEQICEKKMQVIEDIKYSLKEIAYKYRKEVQFKADTDPNQAVKEVLSEQQATISRLEEEKEYWKSKAITLLSQVCRLTPKMSAKEVIEFGKELEDE